MFFKLHDKSPPYSHYEFIREIFLAWIDPGNYWLEPTSKRYPSVQDSKITKSRVCNKLNFNNNEKGKNVDAPFYRLNLIDE